MTPIDISQRCILAAMLENLGPRETISGLRDVLEEYVLGTRSRVRLPQELAALSAAARLIGEAAVKLQEKKS